MEQTAKLIYGDCLDVMKQMENNCIDTIICDPPYGLSKHSEKDIREILSAWLTEGDIKINKKGFMGKSWDAFVPPPNVWKECYRVLKPGGTALVFAGTRTQDLMGISLRLAGFECFDCIAWINGGGFPKSINISKNLDKKAGAERKIIAQKIRGDVEKAKISGVTIATADANKNNKAIFGYGIENITIPTTPEAQLWDGWKSHGLKPSYEPILCARKPNEGSYADNALKHGVSGLWIEGGKIGTELRITKGMSKKQPNGAGTFRDDAWQPKDIQTISKGRYPSNLILDEEVARMLDETTKTSKPKKERTGRRGGRGFGQFDHEKSAALEGNWPADPGGGSSRFFKIIESDEEFLRFKYCSKASKKERGEGNNHPTVKPLKLLEYLCRLTKTPSGGIILDPFMGSCTTGIAALKEGRSFIGIDNDSKSIKIARKRLLENIPDIELKVEKYK